MKYPFELHRAYWEWRRVLRVLHITRGNIVAKCHSTAAKKIDCRRIEQIREQYKHARMKRSRSWSKATSLLSSVRVVSRRARFVQKSICQRFSYKRGDKGTRPVSKTEGKYLPVLTEQARLMRNLQCGYWLVLFHISNWVFILGCYCLPYLITCTLFLLVLVS